ncbi:MAG TPA: NAD(P)/FAD-dependent oxidoreductase [Candidatus Hydrogenedentes bacterium]|nr:NAD(P)/FAD-dependent oxidoreductase [Candidatus Hydrogenedentota bacterium]
MTNEGLKKPKSGTAIIIGAGPAGITAAYELAHRTDLRPVILESCDQVGGISKTVRFQGNRLDLGGHRFFTKSDRVLDWWLNLLPLERSAETPDGPDPETTDDVMLIRRRLSRIYFLRSFFDYPVAFTPETFRKLGMAKAARIALSYLKSLAFPIRDVRNIEDLLINRFGYELYDTFFKSYTEKVWGVPCKQISADWGLQRIKDMSIAKAVLHFLSRPFRSSESLRQENVSTSMIDQFMYPKFGPGQLWEKAADAVIAQGGAILFNHTVTRIHAAGGRVTGVEAVDTSSGKTVRILGEAVFSTMPVKEMIAGLDCAVPPEVRAVSDGLQYRDFMEVGVLAKKLCPLPSSLPAGSGPNPMNLIPDTWIYIQEREVRLGRLQIFNNWSRYMLRDPDHTLWLGLEYFCNEGDELWRQPDPDILKFAIGELASISVIDPADVMDGVVLRVPKSYPAYVGAYDQFPAVRAFTDTIPNLFLIGRNGMHRYNNMDHSMLTAMTAVDNLVNGVESKDAIWNVNTEQAYLEGK